MYNKDWFDNIVENTILSITKTINGITTTITGDFRTARKDYVIIFTYNETSIVYIIYYTHIDNVVIHKEEDIININAKTNKDNYFLTLL